MNGDFYLTGEFSGETDFGGDAINVSTRQVYVASYDLFSGSLNWVESGGGIGTNRVYDLATTANGGVKLATITDGFSQWDSNLYSAKGTVDSVIVEFDVGGSVQSLTGFGSANQQTFVLNVFTDFNEDFYMAGTFGGTFSGPGWSATASYGGNDVFVVRQAASSANSWAFVSGSSGNDDLGV